MATKVPGPGYLGLTELAGFNGPAAAAPHADGDEGTGYDMSLFPRLGENSGVAISVAKSTLSANKEAVHAVACLIEEKGTVSGGEIRQAMKDA